jgi:hypothetical protein
MESWEKGITWNDPLSYSLENISKEWGNTLNLGEEHSENVIGSVWSFWAAQNYLKPVRKSCRSLTSKIIKTY